MAFTVSAKNLSVTCQGKPYFQVRRLSHPGPGFFPFRLSTAGSPFKGGVFPHWPRSPPPCSVRPLPDPNHRSLTTCLALRKYLLCTMKKLLLRDEADSLGSKPLSSECFLGTLMLTTETLQARERDVQTASARQRPVGRPRCTLCASRTGANAHVKARSERPPATAQKLPNGCMMVYPSFSSDVTCIVG